MEAQIKRAVKAGNSSAVILPRAWLNKEVRVECNSFRNFNTDKHKIAYFF